MAVVVDVGETVGLDIGEAGESEDNDVVGVAIG